MDVFWYVKWNRTPPSSDGEAPAHEEVDYYVDTIAAVVQAEIGL